MKSKSTQDVFDKKSNSPLRPSGTSPLKGEELQLSWCRGGSCVRPVTNPNLFQLLNYEYVDTVIF